ncbi:tyrosine-type recombinase/integrase [Novosphingobium rosa]|uniref:tyrosine-type recombinase/integrase n=1 Tax=Novosphingobium rosa TaxID=76978 RepID=UPI000A00794C|nr:tyrosine-type recombinase/integrase [Novosphingobium rosa]
MVDGDEGRGTLERLPEGEAVAATGLSLALVEDIEAARQYRQRARAANTTRAYASDWAQFEGWCWERALEPLPASPKVVATYLAARARAGNAPSTITRHLAAIGWQHRQAGAVAPQARDTKMVIADTLAGIRREQRARPTGKKAAIGAADLARMIANAEGEGPRAIRDRAVLALGLAAALRRSELVALKLADLALVEQGLTLRIRQSKTDQEGTGAVIAIPAGKVLTPVKHLNAWLKLRGGEPGTLFTRIGPTGLLTSDPMSDRSVARLVQRYADRIGLAPGSVAGHSLRAGLLTEAARTRASLPKMQEVSRQKSIDVLLGYIRSAALFDDHAGGGFL